MEVLKKKIVLEPTMKANCDVYTEWDLDLLANYQKREKWISASLDLFLLLCKYLCLQTYTIKLY